MGEADQGHDGKAGSAGDRKVQTMGQRFLLERLIERLERVLGAVAQALRDFRFRKFTREPRSQRLIGQQPIKRRALDEAQVPGRSTSAIRGSSRSSSWPKWC